MRSRGCFWIWKRITWSYLNTDLGLTHYLMGFSIDCWLRQCSSGRKFQPHKRQTTEWRLGGLQNHIEGSFPGAGNAAHSQMTSRLAEFTPEADGSDLWLLSTPLRLSTGIFSGEWPSSPPVISTLQEKETGQSQGTLCKVRQRQSKRAEPPPIVQTIPKVDSGP